MGERSAAAAGYLSPRINWRREVTVCLVDSERAAISAFGSTNVNGYIDTDSAGSEEGNTHKTKTPRYWAICRRHDVWSVAASD